MGRKKLELESILVGVAGEYLVAGELSLRGLSAAILLRNSRGIDIVASTPDGSRAVSIQVKTNSHGTSKWILSKKNEDYRESNLFYLFVSLSELGTRAAFHVVPSAKVADYTHHQGEATVASLVVWKNGALRRRDYRSFNIRSVEGPDDFASLREAVERRYRRLLEESSEMPDLIVIDGGKGQLSAALEALKVLGVEETPVLGLAKREEEVYVPGKSEGLRWSRSDPGLQLLQRIRDETHRFALMKSRQRMRKKALRSSLDDLRGVGPTRRKTLLRELGSLKAVREASLEQLEALLGPVVGSKVHAQLHAASSCSTEDPRE